MECCQKNEELVLGTESNDLGPIANSMIRSLSKRIAMTLRHPKDSVSSRQIQTPTPLTLIWLPVWV